jgi:glycosyltransferase involved in cell wall biosynthesis
MINVFTLRDFTYQGGGLLRIIGVLKALDFDFQKVRLLSNSTDAKSVLEGEFPKLDIHFIELVFSKNDKRLFQLALSILPITLVNFLFRKKLYHLELVSEKYDLKEQVLFCCEYLDLSLGYFMKKNGLISGYVCDIHGLVPNEFITKKRNKIYNFFRYLSSTALDLKVFSSANGVVYASSAMKRYMEDRIPKLKGVDHIIMPYLVSLESVDVKVCPFKLAEIKKEHFLKEEDDIIFFAGSFKELGGVMDLLEAFHRLAAENDRVILFIIGQGEEASKVRSFIELHKLGARVIHIERIRYSELRTYQEIASVLVCPDRYNLYSNMITHLKYVDSLVSNKIVINGCFDAVKEINHNQKLSINFCPSSVPDLFDKIRYCLDNKEFLKIKYNGNVNYVRDNMTYESLGCSISKFF